VAGGALTTSEPAEAWYNRGGIGTTGGLLAAGTTGVAAGIIPASSPGWKTPTPRDKDGCP
jgi:hypothetical protein